MSSTRTVSTLLVVHAVAGCCCCADELLYRYEGDVLPYSEAAGWAVYNPCEPPCTESIDQGRFVQRWAVADDLTDYNHLIAGPPDEPPPSLWVEWRFRSNLPKGPYSFRCDAHFVVKYGGMFDVVYMYGDAAISYSGSAFVPGLAIDEFHTYRFESLDGIHYPIAVDGLVFIVDADDNPNGRHSLALGGSGGCIGDWIPNMINEWDFVRYGTISYGEQIVSTDPPEGFLDARQHAGLDRFTVTFAEPNYVYIDDITVEVTGGETPVVTQTRRRENGAPETVEIVLDRPIPMGETTRFMLDDGVAVNVVEYTFAPGDTDGDGDADLFDAAIFQNCFGEPPTSGPCLAVDLDHNNSVDLIDFAAFRQELAGPR